jgi:hypothetical protein
MKRLALAVLVAFAVAAPATVEAAERPGVNCQTIAFRQFVEKHGYWLRTVTLTAERCRGVVTVNMTATAWAPNDSPQPPPNG